jgi:Flp pilus assembly protein TadG
MKLKTQSGQSAVEFALVLPLLLILLLGILEFGLVLYDKAVITNAAREGARAGVVAMNPRPTLGDAEQVARDYCQAYLVTFGPNNLQVYATPTAAGAAALQVTVKYDYGWLTLQRLISVLNRDYNPLHLSATSTMKYE